MHSHHSASRASISLDDHKLPDSNNVVFRIFTFLDAVMFAWYRPIYGQNIGKNCAPLTIQFWFNKMIQWSIIQVHKQSSHYLQSCMTAHNDKQSQLHQSIERVR